MTTYLKTTVAVAIVFVGLFIFSTQVVDAHVVIKPAEVGVGSFQTFSMGVPVEKSEPVTNLRLVIPQGLQYVTPNVKPGWTIKVKKEGEGETARITEINWTGGIIPAGQRDEFVFSAKVPATSTAIVWKAYQTYQDGTIVAWDHDPVEKITDFSVMGPYSQTKVVDDLSQNNSNSDNATPSKQNTSYFISLIALIVSIVALIQSGKALRRKI